MQVAIRPPRAGDETALGPLHNHIWRVAYAGLMPADFLRGRSDEASTLRWARIIAALDADGRDSDGHAALVAEIDGRIVGFLLVGPGRDGDLSGRSELMSLYVHPDLHGRGIAQALVHDGLPAGPSFLWVLDGNDRAQAFYRKIGYRLDGATKLHEPSGCMEVRMVRP